MNKATKTTLALLAFVCVTVCSAGCDELVDQVPDQHRAWPTSREAATAVCSQQCRWARRCLVGEIPDAELGEACLTSCESFLSGKDPDAEPVGTDEKIDTCSHAIYLLTQTEYACAYAEPPGLSACLDAARPVTFPAAF